MMFLLMKTGQIMVHYQTNVVIYFVIFEPPGIFPWSIILTIIIIIK